MRKTIVEVKGFDSERPKSSMEISRRAMSSRIIKSVTSREVESIMNAAVPMEGLAVKDVGNVEDAVSGET